MTVLAIGSVHVGERIDGYPSRVDIRCTGGRGRRAIIALFVLGTALAGAWVALLGYAASRHAPAAVGAFTVDYHQRVLDDPLEILLVQSDGQAFATLARDPLLRRPESFRTDAEAAYRAQRPLLGWLGSIGSLGRSGWVPPVLAIVSCAGAGAAAAAAGQLLRHRGRSPLWGIFVVFLPGTAVTLGYLGPEPLVLALALWGLVLWERDRHGAAVALLSFAVLGRETAILVVAGLLLIEVARERWRLVTLLTLPGITLLSWYTVVRLRIGAWPWDGGEGRIGMPLVGLGQAVRAGRFDTATELLQLVLPVLAFIAALVIGRTDPLVVVVAAHAAFATMLGHTVWELHDYYSRVLLPLYAIAIIVVLGAFSKAQHASEHPSAATTRRSRPVGAAAPE